MDSRETVLNFLKSSGVCDAETIINRTGIDDTRVYRHLRNLKREKIVCTQEVLGSSGKLRRLFALNNGMTEAERNCRYTNKVLYEEFCKSCKRYENCL